MPTLRPENMVRFIEWLLLISVGILIALLVMDANGGAVPVGGATLNPNFLQASPPVYVTSFSGSTIVLSFDSIPAPHPPAVLYTIDWHTMPVKTWAMVSVGAVVVFGTLYMWLRRRYRDRSEEIFP